MMVNEEMPTPPQVDILSHVHVSLQTVSKDCVYSDLSAEQFFFKNNYFATYYFLQKLSTERIVHFSVNIYNIFIG